LANFHGRLTGLYAEYQEKTKNKLNTRWDPEPMGIVDPDPSAKK
jgi:hypothetical protein